MRGAVEHALKDQDAEGLARRQAPRAVSGGQVGAERGLAANPTAPCPIAFVDRYNHQRCHETLSILAPAVGANASRDTPSASDACCIGDEPPTLANRMSRRLR